MPGDWTARVSAELIVPRDLEWLRYLLARSGGAIAPILAEAWRREFLAEYLLGLYESLDHVLLLEYYLRFLGGGALIPATTVDELDRQRRALQNVIESSAAQLRQTWAETYDDGTLGPVPTCEPDP